MRSHMSLPRVEDLTRSRIEARLGAYSPSTLPATRRAAVAAILRFQRETPEVLLMKRTASETDRWSGHVSFPGGRADGKDGGLKHTAVRETLEEVGIDLEAEASLLGRLDDVFAIAKGEVLPLAITPFVFALDTDVSVELSDEAESTFWLPLDEVISGRLDGTRPYKLGPIPLTLSCWNYEGYEIWGLTHKMLTALLSILARGP